MSPRSSFNNSGRDRKDPSLPSISGTYIAICCIGSTLFGYGISCMNCMKSTMALEFGWDGETLKNSFSTLTTAVFVGAVAGSFTGGVLSKYGRRTLNLALHAFFIIGGLVCALANGFTMMLIGRLVMGYAVGLVTVASPMVISEISPLETRGSNGVKHQLSITLGILMGIALGSPFNMDSFFMSHSHYMRFMLGFPAILSGIAFIIILLWKKADTPNYLLSVGKTEEAITLLRHIYQRMDVDHEYQLLVSGMKDAGASRGGIGLCSALGDRWYRKAIFVGVFLSLGQQLSGINAFVSLSNSVFENAGLHGKNLSLANTLMSVVNFLMTFPAIYIIEKFGRRPLYIMGSAGMMLSLALVPITVASPWAGHLPVVSVVSVVGFIIFFAVSAGPVLWVYLNEIFAAEISSSACGLCCALNWVAGICVVFGVSQFEGEQYTTPIFTSFAVCCVLVFLFCIFIMKETKGLSNAESPYLEGRNKGENQPLTSHAEKYC